MLLRIPDTGPYNMVNVRSTLVDKSKIKLKAYFFDYTVHISSAEQECVAHIQAVSQHKHTQLQHFRKSFLSVLFKLPESLTMSQPEHEPHPLYSNRPGVPDILSGVQLLFFTCSTH